jgi:glycosyltransferase involved in cell wall biosynthesis
MKIAFLNENIYELAANPSGAVGGLERDQWLFARMLTAAGWKAAVSVREALKDGERRVIDNVEYVGIDPKNYFTAWYRFLRSERPDWLFWEGADRLLGPVVEMARFAGVRTVFHTAFDRDVQPRQALFLHSRWWPLYAWGLHRADRIFVQHSGQLAGLDSKLQSRAYVLPKVCVLSGKSAGAAVKHHAEREHFVAWVAMLRQPKRPDLLIDIARKIPQVRFVVCGGPTAHRSPQGYGDRMVEALRAEPNIEYRGQTSPDEAMQVIADAALLLSTSDEEGFPNTFTQAWMAGTPVVSLRVDPDQIIAGMKLGLISGRVDKAAEDIRRLLDSPQVREEISVRAQRYIAEMHSEQAVTAVFERALSR